MGHHGATEGQLKAVSFLHTLTNGPPERTWAMASATVSDDGADIARSLQHGTTITVSDGSFKEGFRTAAYTILGEAPARRLVVINVTPGRKEDIDSYRSKLGGLYGVIAVVEQVVAYHIITGGQIEVGSDCLVGLQ